MSGYVNKSEPATPITERARKVAFRGEGPNEEWSGDVEVMFCKDGNVELHITRSSMRKFGGKRWHRASVTVTLSGVAWEHLTSVKPV